MHLEVNNSRNIIIDTLRNETLVDFFATVLILLSLKISISDNENLFFCLWHYSCGIVHIDVFMITSKEVWRPTWLGWIILLFLSIQFKISVSQQVQTNVSTFLEWKFDTVFSPINRNSKKQTPLISRHSFLHQLHSKSNEILSN